MSTRVAVLALLFAVAMAETSFVTMFEQFKSKYGRKYANAAEEAKKFRVFVANMKKAAKFQATNPHAHFGVNEFADMSAADFKIRHSLDTIAKTKSKPTPTKVFGEEQVRDMPQAIDWRAKGAVTPIKNQGQCGSCWSFSTTGSIEGQWFLAGNTLTSVSEQELVSCDTTDSGCGGGWPHDAMQWLISNEKGNIVTEASYPYVSGEGIAPTCSLASNMTFGANIFAYVSLPSDEAQMATFVGSNGPLSIAVDATSWQTYSSGILTNCISDQIDHAVLIVGYDMTNSPPYWIVKNSWGTSWGENGYIRIEYGTNQCLLTEYPLSANATAGTPSPNAPPPPPSGATWTQLECKDFKCQNCESNVMQQGACNAGTGFWFSGTCADDGVIISYYTTSGCTGTPAAVTVDPINQCSIVTDFFGARFVENVCQAAPTQTPAPATPAPVPPTPTTAAPTTPAPTQGASFTQMQCQDAACSVGCTNYSFPENECLTLSGGGSAIAVCVPGSVQLTEYSSSDCSGQGQQSDMGLNQCLQGTGIYFENFCPGQSQISNAVVDPTRRVHAARRK